MTKLAGISAAVFLTFALVSGGLLHAALPHDHGHGGGQEIVWGSLHSSLRHEDKKDLMVADTEVIISALVLLMSSFVTRRLSLSFSEHDSLRDALRRGIVPYRKFG